MKSRFFETSDELKRRVESSPQRKKFLKSKRIGEAVAEKLYDELLAKKIADDIVAQWLDTHPLYPHPCWRKGHDHYRKRVLVNP